MNLSSVRRVQVARALAGGGVLALAAGAVLVSASPAVAASQTYTVTDSGDAGPGTLRQAILDANSNIDPTHPDSIEIHVSGPITLATLLPDLTDSVTISGPASGNVVIDGSAVLSGDGISANTDASGLTIALSHLTLSGFTGAGLAFDCKNVTLSRVTSTSNDSGIELTLSASSTADIRDSSFTANRGVGASGYFDDAARVTIDGSSFDRNEQGGFGLSAVDGATVDITRSSFSGNNPTAANSIGGLSVAAFGADVTIDASDVNDNHATGGGGVGVVLVDSGTLTVTDTQILRNQTAGPGAGVLVQVVQGPSAAVNIVGSTISDNTANGPGGGMYLQQIGNGSPTGGVHISGSTLDHNTAFEGGGISVLDMTESSTSGQPILSITTSTLSHNVADDGAAFLVDDGGGSANGLLLVDSSTIADNVGGSLSGGVVFLSANSTIFRVAHSTIAGNTGTSGSGLVAGAAIVQLDHSIVADNSISDLDFDPSSTLDASWSLVGTPDATTSSMLPTTAGNLVGVSPLLGVLALNGGSTETLLPLTGSPVIDAGDPAIVGPPAADQRGAQRIVRVIDIGSVEVAAVTVAELPRTGQAITPALPVGALALLLAGLALFAFSRLRRTRSLG